MKKSREEAFLGEEIQVHCFCDRSQPAANLQFFVNDNRVRKRSYSIDREERGSIDEDCLSKLAYLYIGEAYTA